MDQMLVNAICRLQPGEERVAMVTIIATKGSTPRKAGTAMLVWPDGRVEGTIGGGCGEAEVKMRALRALDEEQACIFEVRMLNDIAAQEGMVCGGVMDVFIQIINGDN